jgi:urate oxidase
MGLRVLAAFPALSQVSFRGENHTYDPVPGAESAEQLAKTYTSPFPAWGLITLVLDR